jgi:hypothetical protein
MISYQWEKPKANRLAKRPEETPSHTGWTSDIPKKIADSVVGRLLNVRLESNQEGAGVGETANAQDKIR